MGVFSFLKKKKREELPMPPPPTETPVLRGDIEPIRARPTELDLEPPRFEATTIPPMPEPSIPEIPVPESPTFHPPVPSFEEHVEQLPELPPALPAPAKEKEVRVFDKTIPEPVSVTHEETREIVHAPTKPVFVSVDDYKRILNDTNIVRSKLMEADDIVKRLTTIKNEEERSFEKWRKQLEDAEKKLSYVDQLIAQAQG